MSPPQSAAMGIKLVKRGRRFDSRLLCACVTTLSKFFTRAHVSVTKQHNSALAWKTQS